jgi:hypothetical protein
MLARLILIASLTGFAIAGPQIGPSQGGAPKVAADSSPREGAVAPARKQAKRKGTDKGKSSSDKSKSAKKAGDATKEP